MKRRTFLGSLAGAAGLTACAVSGHRPAPPSLRKAIASYEVAKARLAPIEASYSELAPVLDAFPSRSPEHRRLVDLEAELHAAVGTLGRAEDAVIARMARADIGGCVEGGILYIAADVQPEDRTELVVMPLARIRGF